ncbi:hypothetical protein SAMN04488026_102369 [Aliiruegeria lutimaris]|uniref:Uncharacterized protein n=1 Tax=Aliiruegeria lutimaris TaxID=571298 RepID=A0A1G8WCZ7_9RHOB|nr:hypothetical protein SAMN04488026_102369 [Aliiruegeria lutimaris]
MRSIFFFYSISEFRRMWRCFEQQDPKQPDKWESDPNQNSFPPKKHLAMA